jgi:hypothetical protein
MVNCAEIMLLFPQLVFARNVSISIIRQTGRLQAAQPPCLPDFGQPIPPVWVVRKNDMGTKFNPLTGSEARSILRTS